MKRVFIYVLGLWLLALLGACGQGGELFTVTPSADENLSVSVSAQGVTSGLPQSFTVTPKPGFAVQKNVNGTCPPGSWTGNVYTTGTIVSDCAVIFSSVPNQYQVTPVGDGYESFSPSSPVTVNFGGVQTFSLDPLSGYSLSATVTGTCPFGTWNGMNYTTGAITANCSVGFSASRAVSPSISMGAILTSAINVISSSVGSVSLRWKPATDSVTSAANLKYTVCVSPADPAAGSFSSVAQVLAGTCVNLFGTTSTTVNVTPGHAYLFNVVVTNQAGATSVYEPKGEFVDTALVNYFPFEQSTQGGISDDVVTTSGFGGNYLVVAQYNGSSGGGSGLAGVANTGSPGMDRFGNIGLAWSFSASDTDCVMTQSLLSTTVTGTQARTITFWTNTGVSQNPNVTVPVSYGWHNGGSASHFGIYGTGGGDWNLWAYGEDSVTSFLVSAAIPVWQFWALTYDPGTNKFTGYSSSTSADPTSHQYQPSIALNTDHTPLFIGCGIDAPGSIAQLTHYLTGQVDDVRVFKRVLCDGTGTNGCSSTSANEIAALFHVSQVQ